MSEGKREQWLLWGLAGLGAAMAGRATMAWWRQYDFRGKTALVTGGSRGLGLVMARELAREGARVAICARDPEELARAEEDLARRGATARSVACDLADPLQIQSMVGEVVDSLGRIDVLINNAGVIQVGPLEVMTLADFEQAMNIHFWGPLRTILEVLPQMRRRGEGRIVNISSIGGKISVPHLLPYCASKFALTGLSEGLRAELAKDGIAVTTVCPGLMRTGSPRNATFKGQNEKEYAWFAISDSLPGLSVSAESAARQILAACKRGDAELVVSLPARAAVLFHGVFPGLTADLAGIVNRMLPGTDGHGMQGVPGRESESPLTRSWLTTLSGKAAQANNEVM